MPKGTPLTDEEQTRRRMEIRDAAVKLFYEQGFTETSMRQIAEATGAGKSTLYDYFKTKDEILVSYFENEIIHLTEMVRKINQQPVNARKKLEILLNTHLEFLLDNRQFYLRMTAEAQRMGIDSQTRIQQGRHQYQDMICELIEQGIREGTFRPVNPRLVMRIILSSLTPMVFSTRPSGSPEQMLAESLDIILRGIAA
jgi:TetR/AcrR family transcriptional regulator, cholesterol catabolism regulator